MITCLALSRAEAKAGFLAAASSADPADVLPGNSLLMLHSELRHCKHYNDNWSTQATAGHG